MVTLVLQLSQIGCSGKRKYRGGA